MSVGQALDHGVDEDEGREEAGVHEGEVDEVAAAHAVAEADDGAPDLGAEVVEEEEEVAGVVGPGGWKVVLVM